jgi:hypothetical protein
MEPAGLPAQHMWTKHTGQTVIDSPYRLPAGRRATEKLIGLVHGLPIGTLWSHTFSEEDAAGEAGVSFLFYDPVVLAGCGKSSFGGVFAVLKLAF